MKRPAPTEPSGRSEYRLEMEARAIPNHSIWYGHIREVDITFHRVLIPSECMTVDMMKEMWLVSSAYL